MERTETQTKIERCALRLVAAWLAAISVSAAAAGGEQTGGSLVAVAVLTLVFFALFTTAAWRIKSERLDAFLFAAAAIVTSFIHVAKIRDIYFCFAVILCLVIAGWILFARGRLPAAEPRLGARAATIWVAALAVALFLFIAVLTSLRYLQYYSPNFDFGIFSNMFHHMREDLSQTVSCERDAVISHFNVHISPIYYLFLPFYALIPSPVTLLVLQAAVVAGGVVPLCLLAKRRGLKPLFVALLATAYLAYPAFTGGCFYDLHENKFLPVLILSAVCCYESKRFPLMYLFAALTLFVKEDAPVYMAVFGLYLLLGRREYKHGTALFLLSVAYFLFALTMLEQFGLGAMTWRYDNISDSGLIGIFKTLFTDPMRVLAQCLTAEKLVFVLQMLLPLLFLPLLTTRPTRFILLIPFVLVNLMTNYQYQYSVHYQYTYGSGALLFYAAVLNLSDISERTGYRLLCGAALASALLFTSVNLSRTSLIGSYAASRDTRAAIADALASIPDDASVAADTFFVAHIARRDLIFEYPSKNETEYIVLDLRFIAPEKARQTIRTVEDGGYTLVTKTDGAVAVLKLAEGEEVQ